MMNTNALIAFVLVATSTVSVIVRALPTGAPVCTIGDSAPSGPHTSAGRNPQTGPLAVAGFIVKIGDQVLDVDTPITVQAYEDVRVVVTSEGGEQPFRGALVIVSKVGSPIVDAFSLTMEDETKLQVSPLCPPLEASGVTHIDNVLKTSVEATMRFNQNFQDISLDVNVVVINRLASQGGSAYYYSQYKINVQGATLAPTVAPIVAPTVTPTAAPADVPTCGSNGSTFAPTHGPTCGSCGSRCGLFRLGIFCPLTVCGFFGRVLFGARDCLKKHSFFVNCA